MDKSLTLGLIALGLITLAPPAFAASINTNVESGQSAEGTVTVDAASGNEGNGMAPWVGSLSASVRSGQAPLAVTFTANGLSAGAYIIDFGDGTNSGSITATLMSNCPPGAMCPGTLGLSVKHTYTADGTYTAILLPYASCMWQGEVRCQMQPAPLGQAQIIVGSNINSAGDDHNGGTVTGGDGGNDGDQDSESNGGGANEDASTNNAGFFGATTASERSHTEATTHADDEAAVQGTTTQASSTVSAEADVEAKGHGFFWNVVHLWGLF